MMRNLSLVWMILAAPPAAAQGPPPTVEVRLSSFDYGPSEIRLRAGEAVVLRLVNSSSGGHDFAAPAFFAAARLLPGQAAIGQGRIEVPAGQVRTIGLIPARGTYRLRCTHRFHTMLGMRGRIIVE